jgi:Protein of unknown function (DUF3442).
MAAGQAAETVQEWLNQFGTAQLNLRLDNLFSLKESSGDLLIPLLNGERNVLFTQVGARDNNDYFTTNLGLGYRYFFTEWMLGTNAFWDATWNNINHRYSAGVEVWRDSLKQSGTDTGASPDGTCPASTVITMNAWPTGGTFAPKAGCHITRNSVAN